MIYCFINKQLTLFLLLIKSHKIIIFIIITQKTQAFFSNQQKEDLLKINSYY